MRVDVYLAAAGYTASRKKAQDLIEAGLKPSKDFSDYLDYAHKLRLAGVDKDSALKQTLSYAKKLKK